MTTLKLTELSKDTHKDIKIDTQRALQIAAATQTIKLNVSELGQGQATYLPHSVQSYPFYLINSERENKGYGVGIDETSAALSSQTGERLFDDDGNASLHLSQVTQLLEGELNNTVHTAKFIEQIENLALLKAMTMVIHFADGSAQKMSGLYTVNEDKLKQLNAEQIHELSARGYLLPIHAMLISLHQVNVLIQRNNALAELDKIKQVSFELTR